MSRTGARNRRGMRLSGAACVSLVLVACPALAQSALAAPPTEEIPQEGEDLRAIEQWFYEHHDDPELRGSFRFLSNVPLITADPDCLPESQYITTMALYGPIAAQDNYFNAIGELFRNSLREGTEERRLRKQVRSDAHWRILKRVFESEGPLTKSLFDKDHSNPTATGYGVHKSSLTEITTGLHVLRKLDPLVRAAADRRALIREVLGTDGVRWQIHDRSEIARATCIKSLDARVPFLLHGDSVDFIACGYGKHEDDIYWLAFDLAKVERRVSLGSGGGGVPFSRYLEILAENEARAEPRELSPLFWDCPAYFSVKNLDAFRLLPAQEAEVVTAAFLDGLDEKRVQAIIEEELIVAREEQAALDARDQESMRRMKSKRKD